MPPTTRRRVGNKFVLNLSLEKGAVELLETVQKQLLKPNHRERSVSELVEQAIYHTYQDPILSLKEERRQLGIKITEITQRITDLETKQAQEHKQTEYAELKPLLKVAR